jgi:hypothetical protein
MDCHEIMLGKPGLLVSIQMLKRGILLDQRRSRAAAWRFSGLRIETYLTICEADPHYSSALIYW